MLKRCSSFAFGVSSRGADRQREATQEMSSVLESVTSQGLEGGGSGAYCPAPRRKGSADGHEAQHI